MHGTQQTAIPGERDKSVVPVLLVSWPKHSLTHHKVPESSSDRRPSVAVLGQVDAAGDSIHDVASIDPIHEGLFNVLDWIRDSDVRPSALRANLRE